MGGLSAPVTPRRPRTDDTGAHEPRDEMGTHRASDRLAYPDVEPDLPPIELPDPETVQPSPRAQTFLKWSRRVMVAGWLVLIGLVVWGIQSGVLTSVTNLRAFLADFGVAAPLVYVLMGASEAIFPVVPGSATMIAAPVLFGPYVGFAAAYAATCLGSIAVFFLSRHVGQELLYARFKPATVQKYLGWLQHKNFTKWFALAILAPVAPDDLICYLAGISNIRPRTFILIILLCKPWSLLIYVFGVLHILERFIPWLSS